MASGGLFEMELAGVDELMASLATAGLNVSRATTAALKAAAEPVAEDMRQMVHVSDVNHMHIRDDIQISGVKTQGDVKYILIGPGPETRKRARDLEFGTNASNKHKGTMAYPFIGPAGEKNEKTVPAIIARVLGEVIK